MSLIEVEKSMCTETYLGIASFVHEYTNTHTDTRMDNVNASNNNQIEFQVNAATGTYQSNENNNK